MSKPYKPTLSPRVIAPAEWPANDGARDRTRRRSYVRAGGDSVYVQRIEVPFEYPVHFTRGVFDSDNPCLREVMTRREPERRHRALVLLDSGVAEAWPELTRDIYAYFHAHRDSLQLAASPEIVVGGEVCKRSPELLDRLYEQLYERHIDRQSFVIVVGGGAVLDMAGYAAATTHRGVRVIRVPTTVLAQNDSGVGVKNGVNAFGSKNFLGSFAPPFGVINDSDFLRTLPHRDRIAGIAESIKVGLIRDADFFDWLEEHAAELAELDPDASSYMIRRGAELHMNHISSAGDPFEHGSARPLDFGHWAAHKLESITDYRLRHGEAVAVGMAIDSRYSTEVGLLDERELERICDTMQRIGLPLWDDTLLERDGDRRRVILGGLQEFREHLGGQLTVTLLERIGRGHEVHEIDEHRMVSALRWLENRWS